MHASTASQYQCWKCHVSRYSLTQSKFSAWVEMTRLYWNILNRHWIANKKTLILKDNSKSFKHLNRTALRHRSAAKHINSDIWSDLPLSKAHWKYGFSASPSRGIHLHVWSSVVLKRYSVTFLTIDLPTQATLSRSFYIHELSAGFKHVGVLVFLWTQERPHIISHSVS